MSLTTRKTALLAAILFCAPTMAQSTQQVSCTSEGRADSKTKHTRCQHCRTKNSQCQSCNACDSCNTCDSAGGMCSMRNRKNASALDWSSKCGPNGCPSPRGGKLAQMAHWHMTTKAYPDTGWSPPQATPMTRTSRSYTAYNNYGMGGYAPPARMVYQPTDTTQMGYSYANVPQWQPNPSMLPPLPRPSDFHNRYCPGRCGGQTASHQGYYGTMPSSCPSCNLSTMHQPVVQYSQPTTQAIVQPTIQPVPQPAPVMTFTAPAPPVPQTPAPLQPATSKVRPITPPPIEMMTFTNESSPKTQQASQSKSARPMNNGRQAQQKKTGGWLGLPSLHDIRF